MKRLLELDAKDYTPDMPVTVRYCVRGVILRNGRLAVQQSTAGDCKILGGGMEPGEDPAEALSREVEEESGLLVRKDTLQPLGQIHEKRRDLYEADKVYECYTDYYICQVQVETGLPHMTASEIEKGYHLTWVTPEEFINYNDAFAFQPWIHRDVLFVMKNVTGLI